MDGVCNSRGVIRECIVPDYLSPDAKYVCNDKSSQLQTMIYDIQ
jgi:hypothetical protein